MSERLESPRGKAPLMSWMVSFIMKVDILCTFPETFIFQGPLKPSSEPVSEARFGS